MLRVLLQALPPCCLLLEQTADHQYLGKAHGDHDKKLKGGESVDAGEVCLSDVTVSGLMHFDQVLQLDGFVQVPFGSIDDALQVKGGQGKQLDLD